MRINSLQKNLLLCVVITILLSGCVSVAPKPAEPTKIILRNQTGQSIQRVHLTERGKTSTAAVRTGTLAPVAVGVSQAFGRGTSPPRLPEVISLNWTDHAGNELHKEIDLQTVLHHTGGTKGGALVIEFRLQDEVSVFIEAGH